MAQLHESFDDKHELQTSSNRSFGITFAVVFAIIGLYPLLKNGAIREWALGASAAFLFVGLIVPKILFPLNWVWTKFGLLLSKIMTPIVMGILYVLTIVPIGLIMRIMGKDPLRLKLNPKDESYWIVRNPPGPEPESLKNQF